MQPILAPPKELQQFGDTKWRINNLYKIIDSHGQKIDFKLNQSQEKFFDKLHFFNVILKARQLGFSTFILIYILDSCIFNPNKSAGVIAQGLTEAEDLFKNKVKFAYDNLPKWLRDKVQATVSNARHLEFSNGSSISVGTSLRGGTFQLLHVSEYGKIAARQPEKALEIKTGALNTVHAGQQIFVESTAEGQQGEFYELVERARKLKESGTKLTSLDPKLHFFPWYENPNYILNADVSIDREMQEYFNNLPVKLTTQQKQWYVKKKEQQGEYMKREYPSAPLEAFEQSMEGSIYLSEMSLVRKYGNIKYIPHEPSKPVYTFWDLGKGGSDYTSIWFFQHIGNEYRFIDYHESHNNGWGEYAKILSEKPYVYKEHSLPHDATTVIAGRDLTNAKKELEHFGVRPIRVIPRTNSLWSDIKIDCRGVLPRCSFDKTNCSIGIKHLDNYRKEWDDKLGVWKDKPRHDESSHAADAFRTFAVGYRGRSEEFINYNDKVTEFAEGYDPLDY